MTLSGRTLYKDGSWNTLCLPFDVTIAGSILDGDGVDVRTLKTSEFENGVLTLNFTPATGEGSVTDISVGVPYIIKWNKPDGYDGHESDYDLINPVFSNGFIYGTTVKATSEWIDFIGSFSPQIIYEDSNEKTNLYLGNNNKLYYPSNEGAALNSCCAYFHLKNGLFISTDTQGYSAPLSVLI